MPYWSPAKMMSRFFAAVFFAIPLAICAQNRGPQIHFEQSEIIDTIALYELDSNLHVRGDNQYVFHFTNIGNEPLLVEFTAGSDPDFNCYYPREPIKPGGSGFITICAWKGRLTMDKRYTINDNSVVPQTIHILRAFDYSDSTYLSLVKSRQERSEAYFKFVHRFEVTVQRDSLPVELRNVLDSTQWKTILIDTSTSIFCVGTTAYSYGYLSLKRDWEYYPPHTAFRYSDSSGYVYYDIQGVLLESWTRKKSKNFRKDRGHPRPYTRTTWEVTVYDQGKPVRTYLKYTEADQRRPW